MDQTKVTFSQLLKTARGRLEVALCDAPELDARLLLQAVSGLDRSALMVREDDLCPTEIREKYSTYVARREAREPVYRIIGAREFHGLLLTLGCDTLEPRDDTECLVETTLAQINDRSAALRFLDLGTGSGAVILALLSELANATAMATDISLETLQVARRNAATHEMSRRIEFVHGSWLESVEGLFDFIASNPPYIASKVVDELAPEVLNHDPRSALDGGADGLDAYRQILQGAGDYLKPEGFLALEIGYDQKKQVKQLGESLGWRFLIHGCDLSGNDRTLIFKR